ncbi:MAG TPA: threonine synthase [Candidatus Limiplasma sp.]|nr:threonine synthase [Candidatus Limiplasma sp.]HPS80469.1 threonine synthase [Candidatus Limiplasma sp.]
MSFFSTRGGACVTASQAVLWGLAKDGGLYVPSMYPQLTQEKIASFCQMSYQQIAERVLRSFLEDYSIAEIEESVRAAYQVPAFDDPAIAPVRLLDDNIHVLELFHGPTLAFKDIALKLLPYLVRLAAEKNDETREISILVATSGDTGKAALEGFKDVPGTSCTVFYPVDGVSDLQKLQMTTTEGGNTHVIGVRGNFDDAQTGVKRLFSDPAFHQKMNGAGRLPSSANSINFGRLVPQVAYYFSAYAAMVNSGALRMGQSLNFVVPTGNFGDILAGYYAKRMGLPVGRLICASNRNNVLSDFFTDGIYYTHRTFFQTMSPSMDILISSNLERLLYECADRDGRMVKSWMDLLADCGSFSIGTQRLLELQKTFSAGFADDVMTAAEIRRVFEHNGYLMDPHTAVASYVLGEYRAASGDHTPAVVISTASPYKFARDVLVSLLGEPAAEGLDAFACAQKLSEYTHTPVPKQITELQTLPIRHRSVCEKDGMEAALWNELTHA